MSKSDIISEILAGDEQVVVELYNQYKEEFIKWSGFRFQFDRDDALDVFQDVVISFYENVRNGKLQQVDYKLKTYLFAVGKNMILNRIKYNQRFDQHADPVDRVTIYNTAAKEIEVTDRHKVIIQHLSSLGEPCQSILRMFFYQGYSMEAIAHNLNYKNADVVKSQKLRCMKELRKKVKLHYKREDI